MQGRPLFSTAMLFFVIPLTLITLAAVVMRELRQRQRAALDQAL